MKPAEFIVEQEFAAPRVHRGRLFRKYFLLILALVCGVLLVSGGISVYFAYQENRSALASLQHEKAVAAASRIEQFIRQIELQLGYAALPQLGAEGVEQRRIEFLKLLRQVQAVTDIAQLDANGRELLTESRLAMSTLGSMKDRSQDAAFLGAKPGQTWFGPVNFRKETEPYMTIAVRSGGAVTVADVNLKFIWDVVTRIRIGDKGKAYVVDGTGLLVADPDIGLVLRKTDFSGLAHVKAALAAPQASDEPARLALDLAGHEVLTAFATIDPLGWKVFVEQPVSEVYATLNATILRTGVLMIAGLVFSALTALWLARSMVRPIRTLQEGAQRIGEGELEQRIEVKTGDELESLADQFNDMTVKLRESYGDLERKVEERTAELKETIEQQKASAEILRVISSSPTNVQPVFEAIAQSGLNLFEDANVWVVLRDGDAIRAAAISERDPERIAKWRAAFPTPVTRDYINATAILDKSVVDVTDVQRLPPPLTPGMANFAATGYRAVTIMPMMRGDEGIGAIGVARTLPGPLGAKQIALLRTFADQAVIAIENVRLFNETKEALEHQRASAGILGIIASSVEDARPVFDAIARAAAGVLENARVQLFLLRDGEMHHVGGTGLDALQLAGLRKLFPAPLDRTGYAGAAVLGRRTIHVPDVLADPDSPEMMKAAAAATGLRSILAVPMIREGEAIGCITTSFTEPVAFTDKQVALLKSFSDQAVIAIQNARLFREIQEKSRQLEISDKHKSEFLANMSHELRTPLNAIIGFSEVLLEKLFGELNEKQLDYLQDIHSSGRHLLSLINDILDLSKIEAGRMELDLGAFEVAAALSNAMTLVRERAQRHGIALALEAGPQLGEIRADERKFKQILLNLLSNAVKFTPDGGRVVVRAQRIDGTLEVAVQDTGIGIAAADQQTVFEEFRQVGRHYTNKQEGTGLGLALTRRFVELHGGTIRLESEPGRGSTFTFTIPSAP